MIPWVISVDAAIDQALVAARTPFGVQVFSLLTEFGGALIVIAVMAAALIVFWRGKRWAYALGLLISLGGSLTVAYLLKNLIERARPPIEWHAVVESSYSFPSNHATVAMALYGFLMYAAWKLFPRYRVLFVPLCATLILLVGFSRLYLGVHYPSDVIAGLILGGIFAWIGSLVVEKLAWIEGTR